jgi:hypothetical protein
MSIIDSIEVEIQPTRLSHVCTHIDNTHTYIYIYIYTYT